MIVDLRSDTVTRPTVAMREAMMAAPLGDDVFGDDPTVNALQRHAASLLNKEAALFVPSGTMSNQLALRAHCRPGDEVIAHAGCHMFNYESGASAALAGVQMRLLSSNDGSLPVGDVEAGIHQTTDPHMAPTTLITFENTHNGCGGVVVPEANVAEVAAIAKARGIGLHLDGARLFNAAVASGVSVAELAAHFDTVSICLSKGLGAPVGSLLVGSTDLISRAYRFRKMYGGGMRQAGILAGAGLHALEHHIDRLADDHARAQTLATAIDSLPGLSVEMSRVQSNLIYFDIDKSHPLAVPGADGVPHIVNNLKGMGVLIAGGGYRLRAVTHLMIGDAELTRAIDVFKRVLSI
jgi:threonine aldolase